MRHFEAMTPWLRRRLSRAARPAFAFDFDGTLAPIVDRPERARMPAATARAIRRLRALAPVAVLSGRALADLRKRAPRDAWLHGLSGADRRLDPARRALADVVRGWDGAILEDKGAALALHYRRTKRRRVQVALPGVRRIQGRKVLEFRPADAPGKGEALDRFRARFRSDFVVYFGDDAVDEDAFRRADLGVRVGFPRRGTAARCFLRSPREIPEAIRTIREALDGR
jgi:trehalose-phosphatase